MENYLLHAMIIGDDDPSAKYPALFNQLTGLTTPQFCICPKQGS
jgi:hypothetical protein